MRSSERQILERLDAYYYHPDMRGHPIEEIEKIIENVSRIHFFLNDIAIDITAFRGEVE